MRRGDAVRAEISGCPPRTTATSPGTTGTSTGGPSDQGGEPDSYQALNTSHIRRLRELKTALADLDERADRITIRRLRREQDQLRSELVAVNSRLVRGLARRFCSARIGDYHYQQELEAEGTVGLYDGILAAEDATDRDPAECSAIFSTRIRQRLSDAARREDHPLLGPGDWAARRDVLHAAALFLRTEGRAGTDREIQALLPHHIPVRSIARIRREITMVSTTSVIAGTDTEIGDTLIDPTAGPEDELEISYLAQALRDSLAAMPLRDRLVVSRRLGLDGGRRETYTEIGARIGLSRERVRQIVATAGRLLPAEVHDILLGDGTDTPERDSSDMRAVAEAV